MYVMNISTPANFFHALRRQLARPFRKPMVVMSPKSLLRHPMCVSKTSEFAEGNKFLEILDDEQLTKKEKSDVKRLILCSGKIYYDLHKYRLDNEIKDVAIMRLEQLYPIDLDTLDVMMAVYKKAEVYWVQEEPENMGAWSHVALMLSFVDMKLISRKASASPATGFKKIHDANQERIVKEAFSL